MDGRELPTRSRRITSTGRDAAPVLRALQPRARRGAKTMTHAKAETTPAAVPLPAVPERHGVPLRQERAVPVVLELPSANTPARWTERASRAPPSTRRRVPPVGAGMIKRTRRLGPFLGCSRTPAPHRRPRRARARRGPTPRPSPPAALPADACDGILNIDAKGFVVASSQPPCSPTCPCPRCQSPMNLRPGIRGPWLGCSQFPKCRGRGKWADVPKRSRRNSSRPLEAHDKSHPVPIIRTLDGRPLTDAKGKPLPDAPKGRSVGRGHRHPE